MNFGRIRLAIDRGREVSVSCGVVLDHLAVAMAAAGWHKDAGLKALRPEVQRAD